MDALEAVLTRQSVAPAFLAEPAPDDAALDRDARGRQPARPITGGYGRGGSS